MSALPPEPSLKGEGEGEQEEEDEWKTTLCRSRGERHSWGGPRMEWCDRGFTEERPMFVLGDSVEIDRWVDLRDFGLLKALV